MSTITSIRIAYPAIGLVLLMEVAACADNREASFPIPDDPGVYALTDDGLQQLDGDADWEQETWPDRQDMPSNVQFVINDPALAGRSGGTSIELWRVPWVRSEINAQDQAMPIEGSQWAVAPIEEFSVPFRYESLEGDTSIVHIVPTAPLEPGLYMVRVTPGARQARIGVAWSSVDQRQYAAANCVDRYEADRYRPCSDSAGGQIGARSTPGAGYPYNPGVSANTSNGSLGSLSAPEPAPAPAPTPAPIPAPAPTAAAPAATQTNGLQIVLTDPVRQNGGLLIQGVLINTSGQVQAIPNMQASLENEAGQEVRRWAFQPPVPQLGPGERASFQTEVNPMPPGVARASVAFIAAQ
ncbi:MAG TPA: hypothetical protein VGF43_01575 [Dongiaceae bacterium]|jgi:hypothetical protein